MGTAPAENRIRAVVFDVGETLIDESRVWARWADWMGVSRLTFFTVLGATIARGEPQGHAFEVIDPNFRPWEELERRRQAGEDDGEPDQRDLYPDVIECLEALHAGGLKVGVAGNQFAESETWLARLRPSFDMVGSSERWGMSKPEAGFFAKVAAEMGMAPGEIAYVGDRIDNDIRPAAAAGMTAVLIKRGPWAHILSDGVGDVPAQVINSLLELAPLLSAGRESS